LFNPMHALAITGNAKRGSYNATDGKESRLKALEAIGSS